jgi:hypothetical protein
MWPNLFIVGAAKAGTTSLYEHLKQHPDVFMSAEKEPHFFSQVDPLPSRRGLFNHVSDRSEYLALFREGETFPIRGEASTSYLWDKATPTRIAAVQPDARIIMMLREPVARAYSHYLNDVREGVDRRPFLEGIREDLASSRKGWGVTPLYVDLGMYCEQVARYFDVFRRDRCLVLFFEEFVSDVQSAMRSVCDFLDLQQMEFKPEKRNVYAEVNWLGRLLLQNPTARVWSRKLVPRWSRALAHRLSLRPGRKPPLDVAARKLLIELYDGQSGCLERLLGRSVPWPSGAELSV